MSEDCAIALHLLGLSDSLASASRIARITSTHHNAWLTFVFLVEMGFYHVGQAGLELLTLSCSFCPGLPRNNSLIESQNWEGGEEGVILSRLSPREEKFFFKYSGYSILEHANVY